MLCAFEIEILQALLDNSGQSIEHHALLTSRQFKLCAKSFYTNKLAKVSKIEGDEIGVYSKIDAITYAGWKHLTGKTAESADTRVLDSRDIEILKHLSDFDDKLESLDGFSPLEFRFRATYLINCGLATGHDYCPREFTHQSISALTTKGWGEIKFHLALSADQGV